MAYVPVIPLKRGSQLFEYRVQSVLGSGGFGITYLCRDTQLLNDCVVKEFAPRGLVERTSNGDLRPVNRATNSTPFTEARNCFLNEARRLAKFSHPNIVRVSRFFEDNDTGYFVMPFESGGTLRDLISAKPGNFSEEEIAAIVEPLCSGLLELHGAGIIHGDIKPDNIIIRPDGSPVLIDLGAAVELADGSIEKGKIVATPLYAPPEQLMLDGKLGPWTDIYSLAASLYEVVTSRRPVPALCRVRGQNQDPAASACRGTFSDRLLRLIDEALHLEPRRRPQSVHDFLSVFAGRNDSIFKAVIWDVALKMANHFGNWAKPSNHILREELVAFFIIFPITDLAWRLGKGIPEKAMCDRLAAMIAPNSPDLCHQELMMKGFRTTRANLTQAMIRDRLDQYGAAYLLDRQEKEWSFNLLRRQVARNCLSDAPLEDAAEFVSLMEDVIDRARGRIRASIEKAFRRICWVKTEDGWNQKTSASGFVGLN